MKEVVNHYISFYDDFSVFIHNQCFNEHKYEYKYIFVSDNDEILMPRIFKHRTNHELIKYIENADFKSKHNLKDYFLTSNDCNDDDKNYDIPHLNGYLRYLQTNLTYDLSNSLCFLWSFF